jgi:hypothetical protein
MEINLKHPAGGGEVRERADQEHERPRGALYGLTLLRSALTRRAQIAAADSDHQANLNNAATTP